MSQDRVQRRFSKQVTEMLAASLTEMTVEVKHQTHGKITEIPKNMPTGGEQARSARCETQRER